MKLLRTLSFYLLATLPLYALSNDEIQFIIDDVTQSIDPSQITDPQEFQNFLQSQFFGNPDISYLPVEFYNKSQIATDDQVFVTAKGINPDTGNECFLQFNPGGYATCVDVDLNTNPLEFAYKLSDLRPSDNGPYTAFIPLISSGRMYFSIGYPTVFTITQDPSTGNFTIPDPDGFKQRDINYYTLYDKIEFTYTTAGTWVNPTSVDFFSLPIRVEQSGSISDVTAAGFYEPRQIIMAKAKDTIEEFDSTPTKEWSKLFLKDNSGTTLRLMAPGKAMITGVPNTDPFDPDYLTDYIDAIWAYYEDVDLSVDISELATTFGWEESTFTGRVVDDQFIFSNGETTATINKPSQSLSFFAGAGAEFDAPNNTPEAVIIRELTSAFEVGLIPTPPDTILNKDYFETLKPFYYEPNPLLPLSGGPWYDLYSKALHGISSDQPIYTFAYDDALGQDGTLHDSNTEQLSTLKITLGDMTGTTIPNPYNDTSSYTVEPIIGDGSTVTHNDQELQSNDPLYNITTPFKVVLNGTPAEIYFNPQMVRPFFDGADGIVIETIDGDDTKIRVIFPGQ